MKLKYIVLFAVGISTLFSCKQTGYKVTDRQGSNKLIDSTVISDSKMLSDIIPYKANIDAKMDSVIGSSIKELLASKPESPLSNFVSDVIQHQAKTYLRENMMDTVPLLSLMNIKGLRAPIPKGEVTVRNIYEVMPFENEIVLLSLPGDSIISLFEFLGRTNGDGISGANAIYDGTKLQEVLLDNKTVDGSKNYFLATSDYLANGGDYYVMIMNASYKKEIGIKLREAIIEEVQTLNKSGVEVDGKLDGRIIFK